MCAVAGVDPWCELTPAELYYMARQRQSTEWDKWASMMAFIHNMISKPALSPAKFHPFRDDRVSKKPINFDIPEETALALAGFLNEGETAFGRRSP